MYKNFKYYDHLLNDVVILNDVNITENEVLESFMNTYSDKDEYLCKAFERYMVDKLSYPIYNSFDKEDIDKSWVFEVLYGRMRYLCKENVNPNRLEYIHNMTNSYNLKSLGEEDITNIINEIRFTDNLVRLEKNLISGYKIDSPVFDKYSIEALQALEFIKNIIKTHDIKSETFECAYNNTCRILYKFKDIVTECSDMLFLNEQCDVISGKFCLIEKYMMDQITEFIEYFINEFRYLHAIARERMDNEFTPVTESFNYESKNEEFDQLIESLFGEDSPDELCIESFDKLLYLASELVDYEVNLEASSRIITKGTEKVTKGIDNIAAKAGGMTKSDSKTDQIKRGARVVDERASGAINKILDKIMNFTRDQKREKIITGKNTVKLSKALKFVIGIATGASLAKYGFSKMSLISKLKYTPSTLAISIIGILVAKALSKHTEERERKRILLDLETELKIVKEKIEDAKGDNARKEKYELMRIQANLEKEITRIKHGLRYY